MDKLINCVCPVCKASFTSSYNPMSVFFPCEHIVHTKCLTKLCSNSPTVLSCPICNEHVTTTMNDTNLPEDAQIYTDVMALKNIKKHKNFFDYFRMTQRITRLTCLAGYLKLKYIFHKPTLIDHLNACKSLRKIFNIHVTIHEPENTLIESNTDDVRPKVYIFNHSHMSDVFVVQELCRHGYPECTGIASPAVYKKAFNRIFMAGSKVRVIQRGKTHATQLLQDIAANGESIALFPQGNVMNNGAISTFRSGAFKVGVPVVPVVVKHKIPATSQQIGEFLSEKRVDIDIYILDEVDPSEYETITNEMIDDVRKEMADVGRFKLSRVSNRAIVDK